MPELTAALTERFCRYVAVTSQSDAGQSTVPSTPGQLELARLLADELKQLGLNDVHVDEHGILTAWRQGSVPSAPKIGFVTHLDTVDVGLSPDIKPQVLRFDGASLCLNREKDLWLSPKDRPELMAYLGQDIIFSDGSSVLGADNKAGVSIVMQLLQNLHDAPFPCGELYVAFVPDEEIGLRGAKRLDLNRFPVDFAYTIDGAEVGELVYETFNAALVTVTIQGVPAHPISAKGVLVNPVLVAHDLVGRFNRLDTPEHTEGREGYFYVTSVQGGPAQAKVLINIRDFDRSGYDSKANQAELSEKHTGVQSEHQAVLAPVTKGLEDQRSIDLEGVNLRVLQKPAALNLSALRELRFRDSPAHPRGDGAASAFQTACNEPGTGVRIADIVPAEGAEEGPDILVESGDVPEDYFCRHKQKLSPIGDVFS